MHSALFINALGLLLLIAGFIIGLGAVTVIDLHGFLGRKSSYWTEATTRTHKVTKPLIWIGIGLLLVGALIVYRNQHINTLVLIQIISVPFMILNGIFLSFSVSPFLLQREREGRSGELLPSSWQKKITISFIVSFISWWGNLILTVIYLNSNIYLG